MNIQNLLFIITLISRKIPVWISTALTTCGHSPHSDPLRNQNGVPSRHFQHQPSRQVSITFDITVDCLISLGRSRRGRSARWDKGAVLRGGEVAVVVRMKKGGEGEGEVMVRMRESDGEDEGE